MNPLVAQLLALLLGAAFNGEWYATHDTTTTSHPVSPTGIFFTLFVFLVLLLLDPTFPQVARGWIRTKIES